MSGAKLTQGKICNYLINQNETKLQQKYYSQFETLDDLNDKPDSCRSMANHFYLMNKCHFENVPADERSFYKVLKFWDTHSLAVYGIDYEDNPDRYQVLMSSNYGLDCLNYLNRTKLDIFHPDLANLQKWHLFVSLFADSLICKPIPDKCNEPESEESNIDKVIFNFGNSKEFWETNIQPFGSFQLKLWMIENAEHKYDKSKKPNQKNIIFDSIKRSFSKDHSENNQNIKTSQTGKNIAAYYSLMFAADPKITNSELLDEQAVNRCEDIRNEMIEESSKVNY